MAHSQTLLPNKKHLYLFLNTHRVLHIFMLLGMSFHTDGPIYKVIV